MALNETISSLLNSIGDAMQTVGAYTGKAAAQANAVSKASQSAQGQFNQASANLANTQNQEAMLNQYNYNAAQAAMANDFSEAMWQRTADWNEMMWEKQADFNAEQAQINRDWQERMANTQYQRAVTDMSNAGLNPILAVTGGGVGTGVPGGATASVGGSSMSSAQGAMASGGLLGANTASEGNYSGQMEYMSGILGLLAAFASANNSAQEVGDTLSIVVNEGEKMLEETSGEYLDKLKTDTENLGKPKNFIDAVKETLKYMIEHRPGSLAQDIIKNTATDSKKK